MKPTMDEIMQILDGSVREIMQTLKGPVRLWHLVWLLLALWAFLMIGLYQLQARLISELNKFLYELREAPPPQ
jgi:type VI protein secretion system component VasF